MKRLVLLSVLLVGSAQAWSQLKAPERTLAPIIDPAMVINDRGVKLEVLPERRALPYADAEGRMVNHHLVSANATAPIGPYQLGVVFNHALQQQGFITGEIAFKPKAGQKLNISQSSVYPGLRRFGPMYVVTARTPSEFIALMKRLQARADLEWVEPVVDYAPSDRALSAP